MDDKKKEGKKQLVDFPDYQPEGRLPFPPPDEAGATPVSGVPREQKKAEKKPYYETYDPDPKSTDPTKTTPGAPNIHDPHTVLPPDADLSQWSPDVDLKD
ncbi:hypothetical protein LJC49_05675, partial [Ruminococcaceae bacterium OttesenSCG-928-I18]|nr:hypothetical protein [Ruminococcaceae bacterium OttesenSCG-928-I18]